MFPTKNLTAEFSSEVFGFEEKLLSSGLKLQ